MRVDSRGAALLAAAALGIAVVVLIAVRTPWDPQDTPPGGSVPKDPTGGLTPAELDRAQDYRGTLRRDAGLSILLGLVVAGVFALTPWGGRICRAFGRRWWLQVLLGSVSLVVIARVASLPLAWHIEHVQRDYGISTSSWGLWVNDIVLSTAITAVITAFALLVLVWLARRAPRTWWAWAGGVVTGLVFVGSFLYPVVIEPAFNDFRSLPDGPLRTGLLELADRNGTPVDDVLVSDASKRTTALNAYVSGYGETRRIVIFDTALDSLPDPVIESIAAHELGHVKHDDVLTGTLIGAIGAGAGVCLLGWLLPAAPLRRRSGAESPADPRIVPVVLFVVAVAMLVAAPVQNLVSRHIEQRADISALDLTRDPDALVELQRRLAEANLSDPDPPALWQWAFGSHPTTSERIRQAENWARLHN